MKKLLRSLLLLVCMAGLVAVFSGGCLQDLIVPCHINEDAIEYSGIEPTSYLPWTTVWDAHRVKDYIELQHKKTQLIYKRLQQDDTLTYSFVVNAVDISLIEAEVLQKKLFDPNGSVGMLLATLFGGTIGTFFLNTPKKKVA